MTAADTSPGTTRLVDLLARYRRVNTTRSYDIALGLSLPRVTDETRADAQILADAGRPHDAVRTLGHDDTISELRRLGAGWTLPDAASVWVAGLWSKGYRISGGGKGEWVRGWAGLISAGSARTAIRG